MTRLRPIPVPEARELVGKEAYDTLISEFGWPDAPTEPMPLDDLPSEFELEPIPEEKWQQFFNGLRRGTP